MKSAKESSGAAEGQDVKSGPRAVRGTTSPRAASVPLAAKYLRYNEAVSRSLREYLGEPDEKNTRTLRATVRRLTTILSVVPKKSRTKEIRRARRRSRRLLRTTSKVRDVDVIAERLSRVASRDQTVRLMLGNLKEEREEFVGESMISAWRLFETKPVTGGQGGGDFRGGARWVRRFLMDLDSDVQEELVKVLKNEGKIEELHSLRKNAKTFRYALELLPATSSTERVENILKTWQDILGSIRDSDVLIDYLGRARQTRAVRETIHAERSFRHRCYRSFLRNFSSEFDAVPSLYSLAGFGPSRRATP